MKFSASAFCALVATTGITLVTGAAPIIVRNDLDRRDLSLVEPDDLHSRCPTLEYDLSIGVEEAHMGIYAQPKDTTEHCVPIWFNSQSPATKVAEKEVVPSALYPLGDYKMEEILKAFDSVPVVATKYDIVENSCAELVLQMMCSLQIPVGLEVTEWTIQALLKSETSAGVLGNLMQESQSFDLLSVGGEDSYEDSIRRLVEFNAGHFDCAAPAN